MQIPEVRYVRNGDVSLAYRVPASSESADPEDVDRMLGAYFAVARAAIEAFWGTVEKFIGDAVVGIFGVPVAHEDDPERAVPGGLRICEEAEELTSIGGAPLRLRVGINTGRPWCA
jgi:adenylate cyclase